MKTIKLLVSINVEDDYIIDDPEWTLEDVILEGKIDYSVVVYKDGSKRD